MQKSIRNVLISCNVKVFRSRMANAVDSPESSTLRQRANSDVNSNVKCELEKLNAATDGINHIETEYEEAKALMEKMASEAVAHLAIVAKKTGKSCIEKATVYYELLGEVERIEADVKEASIWLEDAKRNVKIAQEKVTQIEARAFLCENRILDQSIQDEINLANKEFAKAVNKRNEYAKRYEDCSQTLTTLREKVQKTEQKYQKKIKKSRPYFEEKELLYNTLEQQRERVNKIAEGIRFAKEQYSEVLGNLENISEEIHRKRRNINRLSSVTKDGEPSESFRKSMNDASLNDVDQKKLTELMTNCHDHLEVNSKDDFN